MPRTAFHIFIANGETGLRCSSPGTIFYPILFFWLEIPFLSSSPFILITHPPPWTRSFNSCRVSVYSMHLLKYRGLREPCPDNGANMLVTSIGTRIESNCNATTVAVFGAIGAAVVAFKALSLFKVFVDVFLRSGINVSLFPYRSLSIVSVVRAEARASILSLLVSLPPCKRYVLNWLEIHLFIFPFFSIVSRSRSTVLVVAAGLVNNFWILGFYQDASGSLSDSRRNQLWIQHCNTVTIANTWKHGAISTQQIEPQNENMG